MTAAVRCEVRRSGCDTFLDAISDETKLMMRCQRGKRQTIVHLFILHFLFAVSGWDAIARDASVDIECNCVEQFLFSLAFCVGLNKEKLRWHVDTLKCVRGE
jgi:hypothetical protein